jgi:hypothetical protein
MNKRQTSDPINVKPVNIAQKYADRVRHGKTARDKNKEKKSGKDKD